MVRVYTHSIHEKSGGAWLTPVRYSNKGFRWKIAAWFKAVLPCGRVERTHYTVTPKDRCSVSDLGEFVADFWQQSIAEYEERGAADFDFGFTATAR